MSKSRNWLSYAVTMLDDHQTQGNRPEKELDPDQRERWPNFPPAWIRILSFQPSLQPAYITERIPEPTNFCPEALKLRYPPTWLYFIPTHKTIVWIKFFSYATQNSLKNYKLYYLTRLINRIKIRVLDVNIMRATWKSLVHLKPYQSQSWILRKQD
jgi:hypothetical protein